MKDLNNKILIILSGLSVALAVVFGVIHLYRTLILGYNYVDTSTWLIAGGVLISALIFYRIYWKGDTEHRMFSEFFYLVFSITLFEIIESNSYNYSIFYYNVLLGCRVVPIIGLISYIIKASKEQKAIDKQVKEAKLNGTYVKEKLSFQGKCAKALICLNLVTALFVLVEIVSFAVLDYMGATDLSNATEFQCMVLEKPELGFMILCCALIFGLDGYVNSTRDMDDKLSMCMESSILIDLIYMSSMTVHPWCNTVGFWSRIVPLLSAVSAIIVIAGKLNSPTSFKEIKKEEESKEDEETKPISEN